MIKDLVCKRWHKTFWLICLFNIKGFNNVDYFCAYSTNKKYLHAWFKKTIVKPLFSFVTCDICVHVLIIIITFGFRLTILRYVTMPLTGLWSVFHALLNLDYAYNDNKRVSSRNNACNYRSHKLLNSHCVLNVTF